ncbi:PREDICTED: axin-2 isoform X2 [Condylura cristata]|uniref:axin-2 isoform X2 n=1 Tax=Condylura cristata TaxID=143302 RepID=UPI000642F8F6|nr:PREDICTED: axin-2 isoform X2 [Condylura cristata]
MSSAVLVPRLPDPSSSFREDAPRPPVPGEEGETPPCQPGVGKGPAAQPVPVPSNARRNEDGLGEPEGRASPDSPLSRWSKSLLSLLGDQDGAYLFRTFLEQEKCVDTLDFWFACNGFRLMNLKDTKTLRVAKAIYKRYIENNSIVSRQLKPATKTYIRDGIKKQQIDSIMFDQAQTEIQAVMEENAYQMFLTSDIYLEYLRSGGENTAYMSNGGLGGLKVVCGYLPTLNEEEEWTCADFKCKLSPTVVGLSSKTLRATASVRSAEAAEHGYRSFKRSEPANPYHVGSGYVFAPATSANDSEISSDALTDDSMSMTDSSVDGIPPYRMGSKKQLQREMHRSVKANGQVSLPHFPRTHRLPKEVTPMEPATFAALLIARLQKLKKEMESRHSLEARLQRIREDEEKEGPELALSSREGGPAQHALALLPAASYEEDPQTILDDHLSRVLKTPGCQSPGLGRYSPRSRSPDHHHHHHQQQYRPLLPAGGRPPSAGPSAAGCPLLGAKGFVTKQTTKHVHHHYIHHHALPKTKEEIEVEASQRARCLCPGGPEYYCYPKCKSHPRALEPVPPEQLGAKKAYPAEFSRAPLAERSGRHHLWGGSSGHPRATPRAHPFTQDPAVPPLAPPNTLAQLEEACRRLTEVSRPSRQRHKEPKKLAGVHVLQASELVVTYFFCGEEIPYRRMLKAQSLTLGHFKEQLSKKGNYRYYFKKASDEFACGAVFEEVWDDETVLPMYEGRILGKVERID